jgi:hypothetical protein
MTVRDRGTASLAPGGPAVGAGHLRRCPALVDEHEPLGIEIGLAVEPGLAAGGYVRSLLLGRVRRLFLRVTPWRWKNRQTIDGSGR